MATFTASLLNANIQRIHTGINVASSAIGEVTLTGTASSVVLLAKIPQGATIIDWHLYISQGGAVQLVQLGTSASPSGIAAAFSLSETFSTSLSAADFPGVKVLNNHRAPKGDRLPVRISLSDDDADGWVWLQMELATAIEATLICDFTVFYTMGGVAGHRTIR